jgi:hypothetical protein
MRTKQRRRSPTRSGQVRLLDSGGVHRTPETGAPTAATEWANRTTTKLAVASGTWLPGKVSGRIIGPPRRPEAKSPHKWSRECFRLESAAVLIGVRRCTPRCWNWP